MSFQWDHRQLADEMEIYVLDERIGAGLPMWLPNGVAIRDELEKFIRELERRAGYQRVVSPHVAKRELYERSGHLSCFHQEMFPPMRWPEGGPEYYLRPMNCPHHHQIFAARLRSYRQLPLRLAEYGQVYRFEPSGSLRGLSRVRGLCQNDSHIYIEEQQALSEVKSVLQLFESCYRYLDLKGYRYRLSLRGEDQAEFPGEASAWLAAEAILRQALNEMRLEFFEAKGEAAFYGPKIDVQMNMVAGGEESVASVQLDFLSGERFDLSYIDCAGEKRRPWVVHRAPLGSHERFVALLLEYYDGRLPGWLAPVQLYVIPVAEEHSGLACEIADEALAARLRVQVDHGAGSLSKRLRLAHRLRPFGVVVVGREEEELGEYHLQLRDENLRVSRVELIPHLMRRCASPL